MDRLYIIDDIATMTMLSTRTLRNYIKQGFLKGKKADGMWQFDEMDIDEFLQNKYVKQTVQSKSNALIYDYMSNNNKSTNSVCSIYDYKVKNVEESKLLCDRIIQKINSNEYNEIKFSYQYSNNMVRILLIGNPKHIEAVVS